jgi:hypothetical protein
VTNKPKAIGTRGESGTVAALKRLGFPLARRLALAGADDTGDIELTPGVVAEVKTGKHAKAASLAQVDLWWLETLTEAAHYARSVGGVGVPVLIWQRAGYGPDRADYWSARLEAAVLADAQIIGGRRLWEPTWGVDMTVVKACEVLRRLGYGETP